MAKSEIWCFWSSEHDEAKRLCPAWGQKMDGYWRNLDGVHIEYHPDDVIHIQVELPEGWKHEQYVLGQLSNEQKKLMQSLAKRMCKRQNTSGWITPTGEWFPCGYYGHDMFAFLFFLSDTMTVEHTHARVSEEFWSIQGGIVTPAMKQRLIRMGFVDSDNELYHHREMAES